MRTIHNLVQGSPEWHDYRRRHDNASDAPAMMGVSSHLTRSDLVRQYALGVEREVTSFDQERFDAGHASEAIARPWAEEIIGEALYPIVVSLLIDDLPLSASYDGATMGEDVIFEHKSLNAELRASLDRGEIPDAYKPQMEQQLLVLGASKCLFMASEGTRDTMRHAWYESDPVLRARIIAGWKQFHKDVENYHHVNVIPKAVSSLHAGLPSVVIDVKGDVDLVSNLDRVAAAVRAYVERIPVKPATDEEFADCELAVKELQTAQDRLEAAEAAALARFVTVEEMRSTVSNLIEFVRGTRLRTDRLVKARKEEIRDEIRREGADAFAKHLEAIDDRLGGRYMPRIDAKFADAMKGKKTLASLRDAVATELARVKIEADAIADRIAKNLAVVKAHEEHRFLFADLPQIVVKECEHFALLVTTRIQAHTDAEAKRLEGERERIRQEEQAKLQAAPVAVQSPAGTSGAVRANPRTAANDPGPQPEPTRPPRPHDEVIISVIAQHFRVDGACVIAWLCEMDLSLAASKRVVELAR
jgi:predicted phage-related endonuclease